MHAIAPTKLEREVYAKNNGHFNVVPEPEIAITTAAAGSCCSS
eukprot:CAMPEP_0184702200 /NCGR_PEP_ID=MMETSP0313-20130426/23132_1 /TAXON_ID=2792 /ORGANISM="Porphyridium aerugineum, Strain SAG 1380-2" /LENGTH=42 /DNA_ID= /DNA_START= /DNA_END= /DNA_ORIENTATION=